MPWSAIALVVKDALMPITRPKFKTRQMKHISSAHNIGLVSIVLKFSKLIGLNKAEYT